MAVRILLRGEHFAILEKAAGIPCHASDYCRDFKGKPLLQRGRDALGERINLVHRLDRGASGCVVVASAEHPTATDDLRRAMVLGRKTYIAVVRGAGIIAEEHLSDRRWFTVDRPVKDRSKKERSATTHFRWIGSNPADPRGSIVLCRPEQGRWHQIRRHLNGLGQPIIGDAVHGSNKENRLWIEKYGMGRGRLCLHLAQVDIPATASTPKIRVNCPLPSEMESMLRAHMPGALSQAAPRLLEEAVELCL